MVPGFRLVLEDRGSPCFPLNRLDLSSPRHLLNLAFQELRSALQDLAVQMDLDSRWVLADLGYRSVQGILGAQQVQQIQVNQTVQRVQLDQPSQEHQLIQLVLVHQNYLEFQDYLMCQPILEILMVRVAPVGLRFHLDQANQVIHLALDCLVSLNFLLVLKDQIVLMTPLVQDFQ